MTVAGIALGLESGALDVQRSLEVGALVFRLNSDEPAGLAGRAIGGTLSYSPSQEMGEEHRRIAHEMVHVLQHDWGAIVVSRTAGAGLSNMIGSGWIAEILRRVDCGFHVLLVASLDPTPLDIQPLLETEASLWAR